MKKIINYPIGSVLKRMIKNAYTQNKKIFLYFIMYTFAAAIYPFFSVALPKVVIGELSRGSNARAENIVIVVSAYFILTSVFGFVRRYSHDFSYPRITMLRVDYVGDMFEKIISSDYKYMEDATFIEKNKKAIDSISSNDNGIEGVYHKLFESGALFITTIILIIFIGRLNILIVLALLLNIAAVLYISRKVHNYQYEKQQELSHAERRKHYYYNTTHDFGYGKDIRIYNLKDRILKNFNQEIMGYVNIIKLAKKKEFLLGFIGLATLLISDAATYGILIKKTADGMPIADFSMYLAAIVNLSMQFKNLIENISLIINEGHYVHDFYRFMDLDLGEKGGNTPSIKDDTLEIELKNVSFKYPNTDVYIFKNLNLKISKGEKLAIVGINGAGKSTLVKLITGLFDVTDGEILINGIPIGDFNKKELYSMFSVVFQDINILAYTVAENIACTLENPDEGKIMEILDKVGLGGKIRSLPDGIYQTMLKVIDEKGIELSGGESQKLAIARALYKDANMVILDEPTAALDALAEAEIYENFNELVKNKTAIFVSHRLASTKFCDKIAFFDKDGLKEYGSHDELMKLRGDYYKMFTIQGKYYNNGGVIDE